MTILIPAYEPSEHLIELIKDLKDICNFEIVIIDDGSGEAYRNIFERAAEVGCTILTHNTNLGKGQALKTGFKHILETSENQGVITADCDGQHLPEDIIRIAEAIKQYNNHIILGTRRFAGKIPLRSSIGNSITRAIFSLTSGAKIYDTQTGLRGFSIGMLPWLCNIEGNRFEYEMNMLLEAVSYGYSFHEIYISTVYLERNKSSHFHPLKDSIRIYLPILKFSMSSLISARLRNIK